MINQLLIFIINNLIITEQNQQQLKVQRIMLRKKNYKEEDHFTQLHTFTVYSPENGGQKYTIYFKRYRANQTSQKANIYNIMKSKQCDQNVSAQKQFEYPKDRTLEMITFDGNLEFLRKYLKKIGKIRKMEYGEGNYKGSKVSTAICIFKFQFDLVKCFRDDYIQNIMNQQSLPISIQINEEDRQDKRISMIHNYLGKQLSQKVSKVEQLRKDGFQVVTDIYGQYRFNSQANNKWVENLPQKKRKNKPIVPAIKFNQQKLTEKRV